MPDHDSVLAKAMHSARVVQPTVVDKQGHSSLQTSEHPRQMLHHRMQISANHHEMSMGRLVDRVRPPSLRIFDQIPMNTADHVRQIKLITPYLAGQAVAFVGDSDGASMLLGMLNTYAHQRPSRMLLLDFDERLLNGVRAIAKRFGFGRILETQLYNVFDPLPSHLVGQFDWFYTNPPYGSNNQGASARLFITRGCELTGLNGKGCIILPHDGARNWTRDAMLMTQRFLCQYDWMTSEKINELHRYRLDDDEALTSSLMLVERHAEQIGQPMPYAGRRVTFNDIPLFYGRNVQQPYPHYIRANGTQDFGWGEGRFEHND